MAIYSSEAQRKAARVAGLTYLITLAAVLYGNYGITDHLVVAGNAADTARNIVAHETLFRINIACNLIHGAGAVVVLTALYVILEPVHRSLALLSAFFRLVYGLMWVVIAMQMFDVLRLLGAADYLRVFEADRLQGLARLRLSAGFDAYYVGLLFYGMGSTVASYLWWRSKYIPRGLAAFGVIASAWCAMSTLLFMIFPGFGTAVNLYALDTPIGIFDIATSFWLLFRGLRPSGTGEALPTA